MEDILQTFIAKAPVAVMMRASVTRAIADSTLDELFERTAQTQYTKEVTFSTLVKLLAQVTLGTYRTLHQGYRQTNAIPVSISAIYGKLKGVEPHVVEAMVRETAQNFNEILAALPLPNTQAVPGLNVRQLDGNFLAGTEHRLDCLRDSGAAALPGMSLVVRNGQTGLLTDIIPCEDAYQSERSLYDRLLPLVRPNDLWVADCNFCTLDYLQGIGEGDGYFLIRHHGGTKLTPLTERRYVSSNRGPLRAKSAGQRQADVSLHRAGVVRAPARWFEGASSVDQRAGEQSWRQAAGGAVPGTLADRDDFSRVDLQSVLRGQYLGLSEGGVVCVWVGAAGL